MMAPQQAPQRRGWGLVIGGVIAALVTCLFIAGALNGQRFGLDPAAPTARPTDDSLAFVVSTLNVPSISVPTFAVPTFSAHTGDTPEPPALAVPTAGLPFQPPAALPPLSAGPFQRLDAPVLRAEFAAGPAQASVGSLCYGVVGDSIWFMGMVRNDGGDPHEQVQVRVNLLDDDGNELASATGFSKRAYLSPNEAGPFIVVFGSKASLLPRVARYSVETASNKADLQLGTAYRDLAVRTDPTQEQEFGILSLRGSVRNTGASSTAFPSITAVFYDDAGRVVGLATGIATGDGEKRELAPDAEARFELRGVIFIGTPQRYWLFAESSRP